MTEKQTDQIGELFALTEQELHQKMIENDIKGVCGDPFSCPITRLVHKLTGLSCFTGTHRLFVKLPAPLEAQTFVMPTEIGNFRRNFDCKYYPELIA